MNFPTMGSARRERQQASVSTGPSPAELRLRVENRTLRDKIATQEDLLETLQRANEELYQRDYDRAGGPRFDTGQPFGTEPPRKLGTVTPATWSAFGGPA